MKLWRVIECYRPRAMWWLQFILLLAIALLTFLLVIVFLQTAFGQTNEEFLEEFKGPIYWHFEHRVYYLFSVGMVILENILLMTLPVWSRRRHVNVAVILLAYWLMTTPYDPFEPERIWGWLFGHG